MYEWFRPPNDSLTQVWTPNDDDDDKFWWYCKDLVVGMNHDMIN